MSTGFTRPNHTSFPDSASTEFSQRFVSIPPWDTLQEPRTPSVEVSDPEVDELASNVSAADLSNRQRPSSNSTSHRPSTSRNPFLNKPLPASSSKPSSSAAAASRTSSNLATPTISATGTRNDSRLSQAVPPSSSSATPTRPRPGARKVIDFRSMAARRNTHGVSSASASLSRPPTPPSDHPGQPEQPRKRKDNPREDGVDNDVTRGSSSRQSNDGRSVGVGGSNKRPRYEGLQGSRTGSLPRAPASDNGPSSTGSSKSQLNQSTSSGRPPGSANPIKRDGKARNIYEAITIKKKPTLDGQHTPSTSSAPVPPSERNSRPKPSHSQSHPGTPMIPTPTSASGSMLPPSAIPSRSKAKSLNSVSSASTSGPNHSRKGSMTQAPRRSALFKTISAPGADREVIEILSSDEEKANNQGSSQRKQKQKQKPKRKGPNSRVGSEGDDESMEDGTSKAKGKKKVAAAEVLVITDSGDDEADSQTRPTAKGKERARENGKAKDQGQEIEMRQEEAPCTPSTSMPTTTQSTSWPPSKIKAAFEQRASASPRKPTFASAPSTLLPLFPQAKPSSEEPSGIGLEPALPIIPSSSSKRSSKPRPSSGDVEMDVDAVATPFPSTSTPRQFLRPPRDGEMDVDDSDIDRAAEPRNAPKSLYASSPRPRTPSVKSPISFVTPNQNPKSPFHLKKPKLVRTTRPASGSSEVEDSEPDMPHDEDVPPQSASVSPLRKPSDHPASPNGSNLTGIEETLIQTKVSPKTPTLSTPRPAVTAMTSPSRSKHDSGATNRMTTGAGRPLTLQASPLSQRSPPSKRDPSRTARKTTIHPRSTHPSSQPSTSAALAQAIANQQNTSRSKPQAKEPPPSTTSASTHAFIDLTLDDSDQETMPQPKTIPLAPPNLKKSSSESKPRPPPLPIGATLGALRKIPPPPPATPSPAILTDSPARRTSPIPNEPERPALAELRRRTEPSLPTLSATTSGIGLPSPSPEAELGHPASPSLPPALSGATQAVTSPTTTVLDALRSQKIEAEASEEEDEQPPAVQTDKEDSDGLPYVSEEEDQVLEELLAADTESVPPTDSEMDLDLPPALSRVDKRKGRAVDDLDPEGRSSSENNTENRRRTRSQAAALNRPSHPSASASPDPLNCFDGEHGPSNLSARSAMARPSQNVLTGSTNQNRAVVASKTYGGYTALTWKSFRSDLRNFQPLVKWSRDVDRDLHDAINSYTPYARGHPEIRKVFEGMILHNTAFDEPDAPPIKIINDIDAEPNPPWEFYYTNDMYLSENVPPPDLENLVGCDCIGACDPRVNKDCACAQKNRGVFAEDNPDFLYDKAGKLKMPGFPIYECNVLCSCGDECRNRVIQHGRKVQISIKKTEKKGWGIFAGDKKIPKGTFIGIYSGELISEAEAAVRGANYDKFGRTYLFDLDFYHLKDANPDWTSKLTVDAYHVGNFARFLNHSCDPNCRLYPAYINEGNQDKPMLTIFSRRDIEADEEICFSYKGIYPEDGVDEEAETQESDDGDSQDENAKVHITCECGARNCTGTVFN